MKQQASFISLFFLLAILLSACTGNNNDPNSPTGKVTNFDECAAAGYPIMESFPRQCRTPDGDTFTDPDEQPEPVMNATGDLQEFNVRAYKFSFDPATITVKQGERVRITFTSDDVAHGVFIPDFNVRTEEFDKGESQTVEFTADKVGTFTYRCSVFCGEGHREMTGQIVVTE